LIIFAKIIVILDYKLIFSLDFWTKLLTLLVILQCFFVSVISWLNRTETRTARFLYSSLITAVGLTLLNDFLLLMGIFQHHPKWFFLPIFYTFSFGPLLFFYVKAALYRSFKIHWKDIKHFILPILQVLFFCALFAFEATSKKYFWENDYNIFYGTFAYPIYLFSFTTYSYFSYRFIRHKIASFRHVEHEEKEQKRIDRLRQVIKGWFYLLIINSFFIIFNFSTAYLFHFTLDNSSFFLFLKEMSFVAMAAWLGFYGYYKVAKGLGIWDFFKSKFLSKRR
jgi:hypothetical protein